MFEYFDAVGACSWPRLPSRSWGFRRRPRGTQEKPGKRSRSPSLTTLPVFNPLVWNVMKGARGST